MAPTRKLQQILLERKLCTPRDLARCRRRVRRLSADLPEFDSIWLDALVQSTNLTAWQAQQIENGASDLTIGPCLLLDRIGPGRRSQTFLARTTLAEKPFVIKRFEVPPEQKTSMLKDLGRLTEASKAVEHPSILIPHAVQECSGPDDRGEKNSSRHGTGPQDQPHLAVVSRFVEGLSLTQVVLRRGRLPARVVLEIARQLLDGLATLADHKRIHGDITLENVLLTQRGHAVLVDTGLRPIIEPAFLLDGHAPPERHNGIAPELIGTGNPPTRASDLYSVGCLLWHLLAGRTAHPTGDPLARLAAHQTERIPDIRNVAPETPAALAEAIAWLTEPNPELRPAHARHVLTGVSSVESRSSSAADAATDADTDGGSRGDSRTRRPSRRVRHPIGMPRPFGHAVLRRFAGSFQIASTYAGGRRTVSPFTTAVTVAALTVCVAVASVISINARGGDGIIPASLRSLAEETFAQAVGSDTNAEAASDEQRKKPRGLAALPKPDKTGTIRLSAGERFAASRVYWDGPRLTIKGDPRAPARIVISRIPLELRATSIELQHVEVVAGATGGDPISSPESTRSIPQALAVIESQSLLIDRCSILSPLPPERTAEIASPRQGFSLVWAPRQTPDESNGRVSIHNCRLIGSHSTVLTSGHLRYFDCQNTLRSGPGPMLQIDLRQSAPTKRIAAFTHCTLRQSGPLAGLSLPARNPAVPPLAIRTDHCVLDLASGDDNSRPEPLIAFLMRRPQRGWEKQIALQAQSTVFPPRARLAAIVDPRNRQQFDLPAKGLRTRGLTSGEFTFVQPMSFDPADSELDELQIPIQSETLPGITRALTRPDFGTGD